VLVADAQAAAAKGLIDDISHLQKARVYLYRGTKDACYHNGSVANVGERKKELKSA
jgi:hypothetical protein